MQTQEYSFRHYVEHRAAHGQADVLFHALEQTPFLADQAARLGSFRQGTEDLLSFALPWAIRREDWNLFLRLAVRALNLGRIVRSLASPEVLGALVSSGWLRLAIDVAEQQSEAAVRIRALSVIAGRVTAERQRRPLLTRLSEELTDLAPPRDLDGARHLAGILRSVARELAPRDWPWGERMLTSIEAWPDLIDTVWIAAAEGCLHRSSLREELWDALRRVRNPDRLRALLPTPLVNAAGDLNPENLRERLPGLPPTLFWHTCFALLGRQARKNPEDAYRSFKSLAQEASISWSAELIESGRDLFRSLRPERVHRLVERIADAVARAALWTLCLEGGGDQEAAREAFKAIQQLPPGPDQTHWSLLYLRVDRISPIDHVRRYTEAARLFFLRNGYAAPVRDLALYLDQIAEILPARLANELQNVVGSLAGLGSLRDLVEAVTSPFSWLAFHGQTEELAAIVARGRREAATTASQILMSLAARLCVAHGDLIPLQVTLERLPSSQEDELRVTVAQGLHHAGRGELAKDVIAGIRSSVLRRTTLLKLWPERAAELLREPASLYAAFAQVEAVEDERLGLTALLASPVDAEAIADRWLRKMTPGPTASAAVIRVARHALAFQNAKAGDDRDVLAILHFVEQSLAAGSLPRTPAWLPAVVELGASLDNRRLPLELRAAAAELLSSPWEESREIHENFLFHLRTALSPRARALALLALFHALQEVPAGESRRERTLQLLPLLTAAAEEIPGTYIQRVLRKAAEIAFRENPSPSPASVIAQLCALDRAQWIEAAEHFARGPDEIVQGAPFHALALLVGHAAPETAVALVLRTPQDSQRDDACRRMIRYQWIPPLQARALLGAISHPVPALEAALFLESAAEPWLQILARRVTSRGFDPSAPEASSILERLWQIGPDLSRPCLAHVVLTTLRTGSEPGEQALRLWLHAHLPPRIGAAQPARLKDSEKAASALRQALTLATPDELRQSAAPAETAPSPTGIEKAAGWLNRRNHATAQAFLWALRQEETWAVPHAFLAAAALFVLVDFELTLKSTETWSWPSRLLILPFRLLVWTHTSPAWMAVLAIFPFNALLVHGMLEQMTPHEDLRSWIPKLRFLLGGLPLFGLYMIPTWRRIMKSRPAWVFRSTRAQILDGSRARCSVTRRPCFVPGSWLSGLHSSPRFLFFWLWIVNLVVIRLATARLSAGDVLPAGLKPCVSWALHLLGFAATASLLRSKFRSGAVAVRDQKVSWLLAGTWIFPFPIPLLALSSPGYAWIRRQTTGTLTNATQSTGSPLEWALLLKLLRENARKIPLRRRPWGLELPRRMGLVQQRFLSWCRIKTLLLIPDSVLLTIVLWNVAHEGPQGTRALAFLLFSGFVGGILVLQIAGWIAWRISGLRRLVRSADLGDGNEPHPYVRASAVTTAATMAGVLLGLSLGQKNLNLLGLALIVIGVVGVTSSITPELAPGSIGPPLKEFFRHLTPRYLLFLSIGYFGLLALWGGQGAVIMDLLVWIAGLAPVWALGLGLLGHAHLLHPFKIRHIFSFRLPFRVRCSLAFFLLTLILPLGGLTIPLWIWARARLWPAWERDLLHEMPSQ